MAGPEAQVVQQAGASQASGGGGPGHNGGERSAGRLAVGLRWRMARLAPKRDEYGIFTNQDIVDDNNENNTNNVLMKFVQITRSYTNNGNYDSNIFHILGIIVPTD